MNKTVSNAIAKFLRRATLAIVCSVFAVSAAYGQNGGGSGGSSGQCSVSQIRLRIVTGGDDLRGGKDNLNIQILFAGGRAPQVALNVNKSQNWPNNSTNSVDIPLNQPVSPNQIIGLRLIHIADGGFNFNSLPSVLTPAAPWEIPQAFLSPDNWDMSLLQVAAIGNGVGTRIAGHGFDRFTGSNPVLTVATHVSANACGSGRPTGNSGGGSGVTGSGLNPALNPGGSGLHSVTGGTGAGARYGRNVTGMLPGPPMQRRHATVAEQQDSYEGTGAGPFQLDRSRALRADLATAPTARSSRYYDSKVQQPGPCFCLYSRAECEQSQRQREHATGGTLLAGGANQNPTLLNGPGGASQGGTMLNGGSAKADDLNPQPYPPKGSATQVGPSQTMSAQGSTAAGVQATALTPSGPQRQQPPTGSNIRRRRL